MASVPTTASNIRPELGLGLDTDMLTTEATVLTLSTLTASNTQTSTQCQTQHASAGTSGSWR